MWEFGWWRGVQATQAGEGFPWGRGYKNDLKKKTQTTILLNPSGTLSKKFPSATKFPAERQTETQGLSTYGQMGGDISTPQKPFPSFLYRLQGRKGLSEAKMAAAAAGRTSEPGCTTTHSSLAGSLLSALCPPSRGHPALHLQDHTKTQRDAPDTSRPEMGVAEWECSCLLGIPPPPPTSKPPPNKMSLRNGVRNVVWLLDNCQKAHPLQKKKTVPETLNKKPIFFSWNQPRF